jgi:hypothetical protein
METAECCRASITHTVRRFNKRVAPSLPEGRAALVIAHPGHELRVYHWLRLAGPSVFIFTDGSGSSGKSRLDSTSRILARTGAGKGCIYGRLSDRDIYSALMACEVEVFLSLTHELATALVQENIDYVVGDAIEGYNPAHDLCRVIINEAIQIASGIQGREIGNFDVLLTSAPGDHAAERLEGAIWLKLDSDAVTEKLEVARSYGELASEVDGLLEKRGIEGLRTECLRRASNLFVDDYLVGTPYYEHYGEQQVAAGHYPSVLRYREHFLPLARAVRDYAEARGAKAVCAY